MNAIDVILDSKYKRFIDPNSPPSQYLTFPIRLPEIISGNILSIISLGISPNLSEKITKILNGKIPKETS